MKNLHVFLKIKKTIDEDLKNHFINEKPICVFSDFSAANIFLFRDTYHFEVTDKNDFIAKGILRNGKDFLLPKPSRSYGLRKFKENCTSYDGYIIYPIKNSTNLTSYSWLTLSNYVPREHSDYIYDRSVWENLNEYGSKRIRQGLRQLQRNHELTFRPTVIDDTSLIDHWLEQRNSHEDLGDSEECREAILYLNHLGLKGLSVLVDGKLSAVIVYDMSIVNNAIILFSKTLKEYSYLLYFCYQHIAKNLPKNTFINLCQDLGIQGLRKKKLSLQPKNIATKHAFIFSQRGSLRSSVLTGLSE